MPTLPDVDVRLEQGGRLPRLRATDMPTIPATPRSDTLLRDGYHTTYTLPPGVWLPRIRGRAGWTR